MLDGYGEWKENFNSMEHTYALFDSTVWGMQTKKWVNQTMSQYYLKILDKPTQILNYIPVFI